LTGEEEIELKIPRDLKGAFEPQAVPKHKRRFDGFDSKIISMFARGIRLNDIKEHLKEIYGLMYLLRLYRMLQVPLLKMFGHGRIGRWIGFIL